MSEERAQLRRWFFGVVGSDDCGIADCDGYNLGGHTENELFLMPEGEDKERAKKKVLDATWEHMAKMLRNHHIQDFLNEPIYGGVSASALQLVSVDSCFLIITTSFTGVTHTTLSPHRRSKMMG